MGGILKLSYDSDELILINSLNSSKDTLPVLNVSKKMKNKGRLKLKDIKESLFGFGFIQKGRSVYLKIISKIGGGAK